MAKKARTSEKPDYLFDNNFLKGIQAVQKSFRFGTGMEDSFGEYTPKPSLGEFFRLYDKFTDEKFLNEEFKEELKDLNLDETIEFFKGVKTFILRELFNSYQVYFER